MKSNVLSRISLITFSLFFIALCVFGSSSLIAQVQFQATYSPLGADAWGYCVEQTNDGGYIVAGRSNTAGTAFRDALLVKTDATGNILWTFDYTQLNSSSNVYEARYVIEVDENFDGQPDGYVFVGWVGEVASIDQDIIAVRVDLNGGLVWYTRIRNTAPSNDFKERAYCVKQDPNDADIVLLGQADMSFFGVTESRMLMMKLDVFTGAIVWDNAYGPVAHNEGLNETVGYSMDLWDWEKDGVDDGWVLAGWAVINEDPNNLSGRDAFVVGVDWNGTSLGSYRIGVSSGTSLNYSSEMGLSVQQFGGGEIVIAGQYQGVGLSEQPMMISLPSSFQRSLLVHYMRHYSSTDVTIESAYSVRQAAYGIVFANGGSATPLALVSSDPTPAIGSSVMFHTNAVGAVVNWGRHYKSLAAPPGNYGNGHSLRRTNDGFVMAGVDGSFGANQAVHLVKTDWFGNSGCDEDAVTIIPHTVEPYRLEYGSELDIELENIIIDMTTEENLEQYIHCVTPKRIPFISPSTGEGSGTSLSSYPNPVRTGNDLSFDLQFTNEGVATVIVSDMLGKTIHHEESSHSAGNVDFRLPTTNWPAGTYTVRIETGEEVYSDKILVLE